MALAAGSRLTAARLHIMTNVAAKLTNSVNQSIPNSVVTVLQFDTAEYDTDGLADLANDSLVIQTPGIYALKAYFRMNPVDDSRVQIGIQLNGSPIVINDDKAPPGALGFTVSIDLELAVGDVINATAFQSGGASVDSVGGEFGAPALSVARVAGAVA